MMKYYDPEDIRQADIIAVEKFGVTSLELMENAGTNAALEVLKKYPYARCFLILAGPGNNGGDGFVAARSFFE
ncbi:MAG: NAD(P)H-hydrate epimerase [Synergistaceae bacterium]|nr:NAD(P)H-hydrate epimerase [Synergistaceae bacterium]